MRVIFSGENAFLASGFKLPWSLIHDRQDQ
jgi:hypothetical protein